MSEPQDELVACAKPVIVRQVASDLKKTLGRAGRIHQLLAALGAVADSSAAVSVAKRSFIELHMSHGPEASVSMDTSVLDCS